MNEFNLIEMEFLNIQLKLKI